MSEMAGSNQMHSISVRTRSLSPAPSDASINLRSRSITTEDRPKSFSHRLGSRDSTKSRQRKLRKGLSPPGSRMHKSMKSSRTGSYSSMEHEIFDQTQWEHSQYYLDVISAETNDAAFFDTTSSTLLPGEAHQQTRYRGEQLQRKPRLPLALLTIELIITMGSIVGWVHADNPVLPQILTYANLAIILIMTSLSLIFEFFRVHVKRPGDDEEARERMFFIPYRWRFFMLLAHLLRALLLAANMTIMALDHDFDTGSIIVLAIQPIHLIIVGIHISIALLPKLKS